MTALDDVLGDLAAECDRIEEWVTPLDEAGWRTPTPAAGWAIATTIGHLTWTDEVVAIAANDKTAWDQLVLSAIDDPEGFVDREAAAVAEPSGAEILARWRKGREELFRTLREYPEGEKVPWFGPPMAPTSMATARFMETWAHGLDVAEALGIDPEPTDRVRQVVHLGVRTRNYSFTNRGLEPPSEEFRITLTAPSGVVWEWGAVDARQSVTGSAQDFALLVTRRRHRDDLDLVAVGDDADEWLDIAQAFAGPPGDPREPRADEGRGVRE